MQDFSYIKDEHTRNLISNGYRAIMLLELNSWMEIYEPEEDEGFAWSQHPNITKIMKKMEELPDAPGHSGFSFAFTMRHLEYIAKKGISEHKKLG
jgi:hypothetical protein